MLHLYELHLYETSLVQITRTWIHACTYVSVNAAAQKKHGSIVEVVIVGEPEQ